ncbi:hypothetical protein [Cytophaga aurantiaca]|uniref:hypothetical protein n=1 Tax=Cytophaga aurantiaca TaxID=29530 RepID=UPI0005266E15|nr:hypothetical protein [Cytophaga aurantiaca]
MKKIVRKTYPLEFSVGLLLLIFVTSCFMAQQIFVVSIHDIKDNHTDLLGVMLVSLAVIIMVLIIWEEILFPIRVKEVKGGILFSNRKKKLKVQVLMYLCIPLIFAYVYFSFEVKLLRFILWAAVCMGAPVLEKLISGITNFNDFLLLTDDFIEYKNNEKEGRFSVAEVQQIIIITEERIVSKKMQLDFKDGNSVVIDLDEMELDVFYETIDKFTEKHYGSLLKQA